MNSLKTIYKIFKFSFVLNLTLNTDISSKEPISIAPLFYVKEQKDISKFEENFLKKRLPIVKNNLEKLLDIKIDYSQIPIISICFSGGGFRAMLATSGFLCGADKIGLLNCTSYITSLSGSSWAVIPWILEEKSIKNFNHELINRLDEFSKLKKLSEFNIAKLKDLKNFFLDSYNAFYITKELKNKFNQKISFIDWYGILIANLILQNHKEKRFDLKLSDLAPKVEQGNVPFPIFSVVGQFENFSYNWLEFTPFFIGIPHLNTYVTPEEFGKKFCEGKSNDQATEFKLSYLFGIFGSAFSANLKDILDKASHIQIRKEILSLIHKTENMVSHNYWANKKILSAQIANFTYKMEKSSIKNQELLTLADGGYLCNLPLNPLIQKERKSDIIIILDSTSQKLAPPGFALQEAEFNAKSLNEKFPPIDYKKAAVEDFSVFKDEKDPTCPTVIYIPLKKHRSFHKYFNPQKAFFCGTTNFFYNKRQAKILSGLTKYIAYKYENDIFEIIKEKILAK